jgi:chromosome partitioning protein
MKIITVTNQKGGTGKTSTTNALMAGLNKKGYKVLAVDLDPQCNLSFILKAQGNKPTALGILTGEANIKDAIQTSDIGDFIASSKQLSNADKLLDTVGREYKLKKALDAVKADYDFILIDTPPALSILTINALTACNSVIIPAVADIFSLQGVERLAETIEPIKEYTNSSIYIEGILLTKYTGDRTNLNKSVRDKAKMTAEKLNTKLFNTVIREAVAVKEAQAMLSNIFDYAPKAQVTSDYENFINELLEAE